MEGLSALIHNFNTDCHKQYTNVSSYLGARLDETLEEIEKFYYSDFWTSRFRRKLYEQGLEYNPIQLDVIQGTSTCLREDTKFKLFDEDQSKNGVSNKGTMIALNVNMNEDKTNDSHINNIIMHEFGHRQYNQKEFDIVIKLNDITFKDPAKYIIEDLSEEDLEYFTNKNELRQRIIPIIKEMYDNNWTVYEAYKLSENLQIDDIKGMYHEGYILYLLDNIL